MLHQWLRKLLTAKSDNRKSEAAVLKRRSKIWKNGDLFLVPQSDGGHTVAQVLSYEVQAMNSAVCVFTLRRASKADLVTPIRANEVISIRFVTIDLLDSKDWPVIGHASILDFQPHFDLEKHRKNHFIGSKIEGSGIIMSFLNACCGLEPWDDWFDPQYLDKLLIGPDKKPKLLIYKNEQPLN